MTRFSILEKLFGGLDKVYVLHKNVSLWGMGFISLHVFSLFLDRLSNVTRAINVFFPMHHQLYMNLGVLSFWLFVFLVVITLWRKNIGLSYGIWKVSHKLMGLALIMALLHVLRLPGNFVAFPALTFWLLLVSGTGIACWLYYEFLYGVLAPSYSYYLERIESKGDVFIITLTPKDRKITYRVGQFVYLSVLKKGFSKEAHPFSFTSHPTQKEVTFAIKNLGDHTSQFGSLQKGDKFKIWGPHGDFAEKLLNTFQDAVFIGGGIGIAPFLGMLKEVAFNGSGRHVWVYYCTKYKSEACFDEELRTLSEGKENIHYVNKCSREEGRLSVDQVIKSISDKANTLIYLCGPDAMMTELAKDFEKVGISKDSIIFESFEMV